MWTYEFVFDSKNDKYKLDRYNEHLEICKKTNGKLIKDVHLKNVQLPYVPHIQKQKIYEFLYANGLQDYFKPTQYYMTFDFETLNYLPDEDEKQMSKSTELNAHIIPFMVSTYVKLPSEHKLQNFCYDIDGKEFINKWFDFLFEYSEKVCDANKNMYREVL